MDTKLRTTLLPVGGMLASAVYWRVVTGQNFYGYLFFGLAVVIILGERLFDVGAPSPPSLLVSKWERLLSDGAVIMFGFTMFSTIVYALQDARALSIPHPSTYSNAISLMYKNGAVALGSMGFGLYVGHYLDHYAGKWGLLLLIALGTFYFWLRGSGLFDLWLARLIH